MAIWSPEGRRWLRISFRTLHIATICGVVGGVLFGGDDATMKPWLVGVVLSGGIIMATDLYDDDPYLREVRGMTIVVKLLLLAVALWLPASRAWLLFLVVGVSGVLSHAPSRLRHRALWGPDRATLAARGAASPTERRG